MLGETKPSNIRCGNAVNTYNLLLPKIGLSNLNIFSVFIHRGMRRCRGDFLSVAYWEDVILNDCFTGESPDQILLGLAEVKRFNFV